MNQLITFEDRVVHAIGLLTIASSGFCGYSLVYYLYKWFRYDTSDLDTLTNSVIGLLLMVFFFSVGVIVTNKEHEDDTHSPNQG